MPLKLICKECGETIYSLSGTDLEAIPDIIYGRLHGKCPRCGRKFTSEDVANWTLKISGEKGDMQFFSRHLSKRSRNEKNWLWVGHNEPTEF